MNSTEHVSKLINVIFDRSNYDIYAHKMYSFLKSRILWRVVTSEIFIPIQKKDEDEEKFTKQLDK